MEHSIDKIRSLENQVNRAFAKCLLSDCFEKIKFQEMKFHDQIINKQNFNKHLKFKLWTE